ncbi:MAG: HDIG domain-containing protein [Spirochaetaceae bacterium]|nr:HDIG domain-containing protein [Spirochaetaceae bacterium]
MKNNTKKSIMPADGTFAHFLANFKESFKRSSRVLAILAITFGALVIVAFVEHYTRTAITRSAFSEYEIGQVADRTVIASKDIFSIAPDGLTIKKGDRIIRKGFVITSEDYEKLKLLAQNPDKIDLQSLYKTIIYLFLLCLSTYFLLAAKKIYKFQIDELVFLSVVLLFIYSITVFMVRVPLFSSTYTIVSIIPAALCVMLATILINRFTGVVLSVVLALAVFPACSFRPMPMVFVLVSCLFCTKLVFKMEKRLDFIRVSLLLGFLQVALLLLLSLVFPDNGSQLLPCLAGTLFSGFISGILALGFLTPLESILNTVTAFRLMDLSDLNSPIMKHMLLTAPGTYSHSMMVATLAESACREIQANPLLARVGAYYHDLGKLEQPEYFVENQTDHNKHNDINPSLSVSVIRRHVKKGVEKANQLHLPQEVIDIIAEHHGNGVISYFYNKAKEADPSVSPDDYSYMGEPPASKESAVVMLADTVEAACRTLENPSVTRLEKFIHQLVMQKYEDRQLDKSNLTFAELDKIQSVFVNILAGYYHSRIEYPKQKDPDNPDADKGKADEKEEKTNEK